MPFTLQQSDLPALAEQYGIIIPDGVVIEPAWKRDYNMALDAQPQLVTQANSAIPAFLANWIDPEFINLLISPVKAAEIAGEAKRGDWTTDTAMFTVIELTGETSAYGDFNNNGVNGVNVNWPFRQQFRFQNISIWGDLEVERAALAQINLIGLKNNAAAQNINRFFNLSYLFGVEGLLNYGTLNDPNLPAPLQPGPKAYNAQAHGPWTTAGVVTATPNEVYSDIQTLYVQLTTQTAGLVDENTSMTLVLDPTSAMALTSANNFGVNVRQLLKENFGNLRIVTVPEYNTTAGRVVQLWADSLQGQDIGTAAFSEKMRAGPIIPGLSEWRQKKSAGTWGFILKNPLGVAQMLGI